MDDKKNHISCGKNCRKALTLRLFLFFLILAACLAGPGYGQADPAEEVKIKSALISKPWQISVTYKQMVRGKIASVVEDDVLTFTEGAVASRNLSKEGYSKGGAGYKVEMGEGEDCKWEAVFLHENQRDLVFLKGEMKDGVMTGVVIYQPQGKPAKTGNFTSQSVR